MQYDRVSSSLTVGVQYGTDSMGTWQTMSSSAGLDLDIYALLAPLVGYSRVSHGQVRHCDTKLIIPFLSVMHIATPFQGQYGHFRTCPWLDSIPVFRSIYALTRAALQVSEGGQSSIYIPVLTELIQILYLLKMSLYRYRAGLKELEFLFFLSHQKQSMQPRIWPRGLELRDILRHYGSCFSSSLRLDL